jgi:hypothetical protein
MRLFRRDGDGPLPGSVELVMGRILHPGGRFQTGPKVPFFARGA